MLWLAIDDLLELETRRGVCWFLLRTPPVGSVV